GEIFSAEGCGRAFRQDLAGGATLVLCAKQMSGPGTAALALPALGKETQASSFVWNHTRASIQSQLFRFRPVYGAEDRVLATANSEPLAVMHSVGQGRLIFLGVPLGIGLDERPVPVLPILLVQLVPGLLPITVSGDV